jgi:predicted YcjX-like family ATPase
VSAISRLQSKFMAWRRSTTITIAVAGLSRSGKTAVITSTLANLQAAANNSRAAEWLKGLDVVATKRLRSAARPPTYRPRHGRMLPYGDLLAALTGDTPQWPSRTANVYEAALDVHFWPGERPDAANGANTAAARLRLVIVDYPGEWLVDVPILRQSYAEWSGAALNRLQSAPWSEVSGDFRKLLASTEWSGKDSNDLAERAAKEWQRVLVAAREQGLKWLQPGQFVRSPEQDDGVAFPRLDEEKLWFCPLPEKAILTSKSGSLARAMSNRYAGYQKMTEKFFRETLKDATHHVLLVDVLEALAEGECPFNESAEVLSEVYRTFVTETSWFWRLLGLAGLKRVMLVATKADTVPPNQRAAMAKLLEDMCGGRFAGAAGIAKPEAEYLAAVRATEEVEDKVDGGQLVRVVEGLCSDTGKRRRVTMIDVPDRIPLPDYFRRRRGIRVPHFVPPAVDGRGAYGVPNVRLGHVLQKLLGEALR